MTHTPDREPDNRVRMLLDRVELLSETACTVSALCTKRLDDITHAVRHEESDPAPVSETIACLVLVASHEARLFIRSTLLDVTVSTCIGRLRYCDLLGGTCRVGSRSIRVKGPVSGTDQ